MNVHITLADGTLALVRPIRPDGGPKLLAALQRLSPESRVRRFLYDKTNFTEKELHNLTHTDGINHIALVAVILDEQRAERAPIGVARAIRERPGSERAEVAFVVADEWQGHGVGSALISELARRSSGAGIRRWRAVYFSGNKGAQKLLNLFADQESAEAVGGGVIDAMYLLRSGESAESDTAFGVT